MGDVRLPYSHKAALAQLPVAFTISSRTLLIYPLTIGLTLEMDQWLQNQYLAQFQDQINLLPEEQRKEYADGVIKQATNLTFQYGAGAQYMLTHEDALIRLVYYLCRKKWKEKAIKELMFPDGVTPEAVLLVVEMRQAVSRDIPKFPKLNVVEKPRKYEATEEETEARVYKSCAEKFNWTYDQVLKLTDYQVFWYFHMYPEEREHYEEMDEMTNKNKRVAANHGKPDVPLKPGMMHFDSPEEYFEWRRNNPKKQAPKPET